LQNNFTLAVVSRDIYIPLAGRQQIIFAILLEEKECLKFDSGEEIKPSTECTYLGTKIDQTGDNTTEIKHRINQTRTAINALNSIWWHKDITKNRKLYIYQTIFQSISTYGAEVWQIPTREINKILSTEMDVLRRSARKSRMERIRNEHIKEKNGSEREAGYYRHQREEKSPVVWPR